MFGLSKVSTSDENMTLLLELSRKIWLEVDGKKLLLRRGSPRDRTEYLFDNRSDGYLRQFVEGGKAKPD